MGGCARELQGRRWPPGTEMAEILRELPGTDAEVRGRGEQSRLETCVVHAVNDVGPSSGEGWGRK